MGQRTIKDLCQLQALPLSLKVRLTQDRIRQWVNEFRVDGVYVAFSGGKDSTVLLHIVREMYGDVIPGVFFDTGLEYPQIRDFVKSFVNIEWLKPKTNFKQVIQQYGYPFISKQVSKRVWEWNNALDKGKDITKTYAYKEFTGTLYFQKEGFEDKKKSFHNKEKWGFLTQSPFKFSHKCCDVMKKTPAKQMKDKFPMTAQMASESINRQKNWLIHGCNAFEATHPISNPMSFWTEQDVLQYIKQNKIQICSVYGDIVEVDQLPGQMTWDEYMGFDVGSQNLTTTGCKRTGCMFCGFGCHLEPPGEGRFERMKKTHPKQYDYIMRPWEQGGLNYKEVIDWINEHGNLDIRY